MEGRWKVILGVLMVQVTGGALYIWSRFMGPLMEAYGYNSNQTLGVYAVTIFFFTVGVLFSGMLLPRKGPQTTASIGAVFFGGGIILASFASSPVLLGLTYGLIAGLGSGIMYLAPLSTLVHWFPKNRGLANGICIMGFALSTLVFVPVADALLGTAKATPAIIQQTFLIMGGIYLVIALTGARMIKFPPGFKPAAQAETDNDVKPSEAAKSLQFWLIFITIMFGCIPGIFLISSAAKLGQAMAGFSVAQASMLVMALGICNAFGRLIAGWISDNLGALNAYRTVFFITTLCVALLVFVPVSTITFLIAFVGIVIGFGATITCGATLELVLFGPKYYGKIMSFAMLSYGFSAVVAVLIKMYGNLGLTQVFTASFVASIVALIAVLLIKPYTKKGTLGLQNTVKD